MRPLGIPVVEDKLLQLAVTRILKPSTSRIFCAVVMGIGRRWAFDAVDKLTVKLQFGRYGQVVEADIKGFFDHRSRRLLEMLAERIGDQGCCG